MLCHAARLVEHASASYVATFAKWEPARHHLTLALSHDAHSHTPRRLIIHDTQWRRLYVWDLIDSDTNVARRVCVEEAAGVGFCGRTFFQTSATCDAAASSSLRLSNERAPTFSVSSLIVCVGVAHTHT